MGDRGRAHHPAARVGGWGARRGWQEALRWLGPLGGAALVLFATCGEALAGSALGSVVPEVAGGLGPLPPATLVVAGPLQSDVTALHGDELASHIAALLAGKLGPTVRALPQPATLAVARAAASKSGALVYLNIVVSQGHLRVTADAYPVIANAWDRIRLPAPSPTAHAFAEASVDPEVRAALTPLLLEQASVHKAKHAEGNVLAAACGDLDGDGGMELVLVSRERVAVGKLIAGQFVTSRTATWGSLASRVGVPLREPLAGASVERGELEVGTTDRGGVLLDSALARLAPLTGVPVGLNACAHPFPDASTLGDVVACKGNEATSWSFGSARFDALALFDGVDSRGAAVRMSAAREPNGRMHVRLGDRDYAKPIEGTGSQVVVADLDLDGVPEVVTTRDGHGDDAITLASADPAGPRVRARFATPSGVLALAVCPPEDRDAPALVAVVGAEVWLVR